MAPESSVFGLSASRPATNSPTGRQAAIDQESIIERRSLDGRQRPMTEPGDSIGPAQTRVGRGRRPSGLSALVRNVGYPSRLNHDYRILCSVAVASQTGVRPMRYPSAAFQKL